MSRLFPSPEQISATHPDRSNWVGANAGSGKTHVLTQRVARLLLSGAEPQKILCLTYTKAAAAEMQTRLFKLLGSWSMLPEAELSMTLGDLAGEKPLQDAEALSNARRLFARALETPGGLKIQTIHAFCETLLRRFPLEAGVSPQFQVADDRQSQALQGTIRQSMALDAESGIDGGFDRAARLLNEDMIAGLAQAIMSRRRPFRTETLDADIQAHFGTLATDTLEDIAQRALSGLDPTELRLLAHVITTHGGKKSAPVAAAIQAYLANIKDRPLEIATDLGDTLLRKTDGLPRSDLVTKAMRAADPGIEAHLQNLANWAVRLREDRAAFETISRIRDLYAFGQPLLKRYETAKHLHGSLDFDDLVARAAGLLNDSVMREWVLFKLDQGIDHILVDEAQDTSPQQWDVIEAIVNEFLSGEGARTANRSIFVVGDEKQSIYSFQGAAPQSFGRMRDTFASRLQAVDRPLGRPALITSYRSAPAILEFVDKVFQGDTANGLTVDGSEIAHNPHRSADQGRVDLWPLVPMEEAPEPPDWWMPVDAAPGSSPKAKLAQMVAAEVKRMVEQDYLPARNGQAGRKVEAGDILVLVSRRDQLATGIIRGLKSGGVPVAGSDRLSLGQELAVQDLLAVCKVVTQPDDDLSLAALLRSPICGLSEADLFDLAHGRESTLWHALRTSSHAKVWAFLKDMAEQGDYLRPYEFLQHLLDRHDGRRRLLARLGSEAEDAIDELLAQALAFEGNAVPTLTGFIAWIETSDIQVKREMDTGSGQVRVMTVHGSKGLEAPIVILPDTMSGISGGAGRPTLLPADAGQNSPELTIWPAGRKHDDRVTARARLAAETRQNAERRRLLYVALTRAEDWLILCGATPGQIPKDNWYGLVEAGMDRCADVTEFDSPTGQGVARRFQTGQPAAHSPDVQVRDKPKPDNLVPDWFAPALHESARPRAAPSGLVPHQPQGGEGAGRERALAKGNAVHFLLEHADLLWTKEDGERALERKYPGLSDDLTSEILNECAAVLQMPQAKDVFGSDALSEVTVAIDHRATHARMVGRIDRIVVSPECIDVIDIKTDAQPPDRPADVPAGYMAQLGAYLTAIAREWPDRKIRLALLWTVSADLMQVSPELAERAYRRAIGGS